MKVLQLVTFPRSFHDMQVAALEDAGIDCTILSVPGDLGRSPVDYARFYASLLRAVHRGEYDIVHAHYGLMVPFALAQPVRPVVATLWGSDVLSDIGWLVDLTRWTAPFSDAVISPSEALSAAYPGEDVVIPFGVDTDMFRPIDRDVARERVGWSSDERIVLFPYDPSRPVKNYELAEEVVAGVDGPVEIRTLSGVDYEEMPYYFNASDAVLITSSYEAGPMVVKEAAACNVPVVSTDVGFVSEVLEGVSNSAVRDDREGLVAALEAVLESDGRSDARETLDDEIRLDRSAERVADVYSEVLAQHA